MMMKRTPSGKKEIERMLLVGVHLSMNNVMM
jgi:hypothetical protein